MSDEGESEKQCRICFEGPNSKELGRLIRPCLCKGSVKYVHIKCLQQWRNQAVNRSAFFACPQCHYRYRFVRTRFVGLGTNPVIVGVISALLFTGIVMIASYITTSLISFTDEPSSHYSFFVNPFEVAKDLVLTAFRVIEEGEPGILDGGFSTSSSMRRGSQVVAQPGLIKRFIRRFIIGLPLVGAGSLVHMLISLQALGPVQMLTRFRGRRRGDSRDVAAIIVVGLLIFGTVRALYKVYQMTETITKRMLLRAEDAILEVGS